MAAHSGLGRPGVRPAAGPRVNFTGPSRYNPATLALQRRTFLVLLAVLVAVFVTLYPSLGATHDSCETGECPQAAHVGTMASVCLGAICAAATLSAPYAASVFGVFSRRRILSEPRPDEAYLPPDTQPPILSR